MTMKDLSRHYEVLGLKPDAAPYEIVQAYKALREEWNPEHFVDDPRAHQRAQEKTDEIHKAYQALIANIQNLRDQAKEEALHESPGTLDTEKSKWIFVDADKDGTLFYVNPASIKGDKNSFKVLVQCNPPKGSKTLDSAEQILTAYRQVYKGLDYTRQLWRMFPSRDYFHTTHFIAYNREGGLISTIEFNPPVEQPIVKGSIEKKILDFVYERWKKKFFA